MSETLIPLDLVAKKLGLPRAWIRREAERGAIPVVRAGRRLYSTVHAVRVALRRRAAADARRAAQ